MLKYPLLLHEKHVKKRPTYCFLNRCIQSFLLSKCIQKEKQTEMSLYKVRRK